MENQEFKILFTPKQTEALEIMDDPNVDEVMYGGAKGGGKSVFGVQWVFLECQKLIDLFEIREGDAIIPVGFMGRKRGVDFTDTTLETWKKMIPSSLYRIRPLDKEIVVMNKVKVFYGGMDDEQSVNKFNSAEFAFIFLDQAEEISRDDLGLLKGTLRLRKPGKIPAYKVLLTANPAPCFLKYDYIDAPTPKKRFIQALPTDNPFLDSEYVNRLYDAFQHRPELIKAYIHGSWDEIEGFDICIKNQWVLDSIDRNLRVKSGRKLTSADVARFGVDETVIYNLEDGKIVGQKIYGMKPADETAAAILDMAISNESELICIDADGFGGGVADMLHKLVKKRTDIYVLEIRSGKKAQHDDKYLNARAEFWFHAARMFADGEVSIPNDQLLINDITNVRYFLGINNRFQIESKKDIKKRLSRSPDRADALIYGLWGLQFVKKKKNDFNRQNNKPIVADRDAYGWSRFSKTRTFGAGHSAYGW